MTKEEFAEKHGIIPGEKLDKLYDFYVKSQKEADELAEFLGVKQEEWFYVKHHDTNEVIGYKIKGCYLFYMSKKIDATPIRWEIPLCMTPKEFLQMLIDGEGEVVKDFKEEEA